MGHEKKIPVSFAAKILKFQRRYVLKLRKESMDQCMMVWNGWVCLLPIIHQIYFNQKNNVCTYIRECLYLHKTKKVEYSSRLVWFRSFYNSQLAKNVYSSHFFAINLLRYMQKQLVYQLSIILKQIRFFEVVKWGSVLKI